MSQLNAAPSLMDPGRSVDSQRRNNYKEGEALDFKDQVRPLDGRREQSGNIRAGGGGAASHDDVEGLEGELSTNDPYGGPILVAQRVGVADENHSFFFVPQKASRKTWIVLLATIAILGIGGATLGIVCSRGLCFSSGEEFCGNGEIGNGKCEAPLECCSEFGFCGSTPEHCGGNELCGDGNRGNGLCADSSLCCSSFGFCGTGPEFCNQTQYCGNGVPGNGECANATLCCSEFFFCGTGVEFCGNV